MICPMCLYIMDAFDSECTRCHGKGAKQPKAQAQQSVPHLEPPQPPQPPGQTIIPKNYAPPARTLSAYMFGSTDNSRNNSARTTQALALFVCVLALAGAIAYSVNATNNLDDKRPENIQESALR